MSRLSQLVLTRLGTIVACISVGLLTWFGYTAVRAWQRSSLMLADHRAKEGIDLFAKAIKRDMQGVQHSVLLSAHLTGFEINPSYDATNLVASAFARYPYPESFFIWRSIHESGRTVFFNRRDRPPQWMGDEEAPNRFPVVLSHHAQVADVLLERIQIDAVLGRPFSVFEITLDATRYQVVARLLYRDALREHLHAIFGFTVNLAWARQHYFPLLMDQLSRVAGTGMGFSLGMTGDRQEQLPSFTATQMTAGQRQIPLAFFDPLLVGVDQSADLSRDSLIVESITADDPSVVAASQGVSWILGFGTLAALTTVVGLTLSLRAAQKSVKLTELRSDFVSAVTHELKTPIATIRAVGDTLISGRVDGSEARHDYARLVVQEAKRLTRSVDNLLAFSRITDEADCYRFERLSLETLIREALQEFNFQLADEEFHVVLDVPRSLPFVVGDRGAIGLVLKNLIDNVIRYAAKERWISLRAEDLGQFIQLDVSDRGPGIARDEVSKVTRKFYRGRTATSGGSGLGLAIVKRIITAHGGNLTICSDIGIGTTVSVSFRRWAKHDEAANSPG